ERWRELEETRIRDAWAAHPPVSIADAVRSLYALAARVRGKPRYGEKATGFVPELVQLVDAIPETRLIHLVRDGRDAALSHVEVGWGPTSVGGAAREWARCVTLLQEIGDRTGPERYLEVRYEALVTEPEAILRSICEFLVLDYDSGMLDPREGLHAVG